MDKFTEGVTLYEKAPPSIPLINKNKNIHEQIPLEKPIIYDSKRHASSVNLEPGSTAIDPALHIDEMVEIIYAKINEEGVVGHHIKSMDNFCKVGIQQILTQQFKIENKYIKNERTNTEADLAISYTSFKMTFDHVRIEKPRMVAYQTRQFKPMTPIEAQRNNLNMSASIYVNATIIAEAKLLNGDTKTREDKITNLHIGDIPVMVRSSLCHTRDATYENLLMMKEDPINPGGYFVCAGNKWIIEIRENIHNNSPQIYKNQYGNELARCDLISKPGDNYENSFQLVIRYLTSGAITVEIQVNKKEKIEIPFMFIYRIFGMTRDRDIVETIVNDISATDPISIANKAILEKAFRIVDEKEWGNVNNNNNPDEIIEMIGMKLNDFMKTKNYKSDEGAHSYVRNSTLNQLDKFILPHIGTTEQSRIKKLRYLGHIIHKIMSVEQEVIEPSDRDHAKNKRFHPAGVSLAKILKTQLNFSVVQAVKIRLTKEFKNQSFAEVRMADVVRQAINEKDLEKTLVQSITTGDTVIVVKQNEISNRAPSIQLADKNFVNTISALRTVKVANSSAAKQTERADLSRRVHPSNTGFICPSKSADTGESVGTSKEIACSAFIVEASNSSVIKDILDKDGHLIPIDEVIDLSVVSKENLDKVFVNGDLRGYTKDPYEFARYYRNQRRQSKINPLCTIYKEDSINELHFWTDVGRIMRPLIIVYNNIEEYIAAFKQDQDNIVKYDEMRSKSQTTGGAPTKIKPPEPSPVEFRQWIKLTHKHIEDLRSRKITIEDLRQQGVIEYISAEEQINTYIAPNINELRKHENDPLHQFTHCDIDQAVLGLTTLTNAKSNHSGTVRASYSTNQKKQTCGWFSMNWPYSFGKNVFLQYFCEVPITYTFTDSRTIPNGQNVLVAFAIYTGYNQEDSAIVNRSSVHRGLFNGRGISFDQTKLEKNEQFGNIDITSTLDRKGANHEHLVKGFVPVGTIIHKNDVIIGKSAKNAKSADEKYQYTDKSVIYKGDEEAMVEDVFEFRDGQDEQCAKVKYSTIMNMNRGSKLSSRSGNKNIVGLMLDSADMIYSEDGLIPDLIVNPHGVPTRMCIGQIQETTLAEYALRLGGLINATTFKQHDIHGIIKDLEEKFGLKYGGHRKFYNGMTGEPINTLIFSGINFIGRLLKFIERESYATGTGPTAAATRQPLDGMSNSGGLRVGEMEKDVIMAGGASRMFSEKFFDHSDGIKLPICRHCGDRAIVNLKDKIYKCKKCKSAASIVFVDSSWVANVNFSNLEAMGVGVRLNIEPQETFVNDT